MAPEKALGVGVRATRTFSDAEPGDRSSRCSLLQRYPASLFKVAGYVRRGLTAA